MENLFFLALVAVVGLVRWLAQAAENKRNAEAAKRADPAPDTPLPRAPAQSEEERIRRFMEALGVPKGAASPPPKVTPRPAKTILPVDPFPTGQHKFPPFFPSPAKPTAPETPPQALPLPTAGTTMLAEPKREPIRSVDYNVDRNAERLAGEISAAVQPASSGGGDTRKRDARTGVAARLATSEGLRDAIVLREIFGPPRSMQPLDLARIV